MLSRGIEICSDPTGALTRLEFLSKLRSIIIVQQCDERLIGRSGHKCVIVIYRLGTEKINSVRLARGF